MSLGKVLEIFWIETEEEFYQEGREVVWVYILSVQGGRWSWIHITPIVRVGEMVWVIQYGVRCSGMVGQSIQGVRSRWFILHILIVPHRQGYKR